jgi:transcriptional regulator with XRE-family HTH domain
MTPDAMENADVLSLIGRQLRTLRKGNNLSQREVADAIGLPQSNLSRIENGKQRLNLTVLARMLTIYQTTIQEFFSQQEEALSRGEALTARERQLIESYRRLSAEDRRDLDAFADYKLFRARRDGLIRDQDCF